MSHGEWTPDPGRVATFGTLLRAHRLQAGLSQAELAERAGLGDRAIQRLEADRNRPYRATVEQLAEALRLTAEQRAQFVAAVPPVSRGRTQPPASRAAAATPHLRLLRTNVTPGQDQPPAPIPRQDGQQGATDHRSVSEPRLPAPAATLCPNCAAENAASARFCASCGTTLAILCAACGQRNLPTGRFCSACGVARSSAAAAGSVGGGAAVTRPPTPDADPESERKQVTTLFADVVDVTERLEHLDPEEALALLEGAVQAMVEAARRYDGTVSRVLGQGIVVLFGAPLAREDHAVRASSAALAIQDAVRAYAEGVRATHDVSLESQIGVDSGEAVVRLLDNDLLIEPSALGQATRVARRLEQLAGPGRILLSDEAARLAEGYIRVRQLEPAASARGDVFELLGLGSARDRLDVAVARGLTRFVGRAAELATLEQALGRAGAGHGQVVAVIGEPGLGKSRLFYELLRSPSAAGWRILQTGSVSHARASAYGPLAELVRAYFELGDRRDWAGMQEQVYRHLGSLDAGLATLWPALLALLDAPVDPSAIAELAPSTAREHAAWQVLDPPERRRRILEATRRLLLRASQAEPLLLIVENLHWLDDETQALLDRLVESLATARILLLVNYRPEYRHEWGNRSAYTQLHLSPLGSHDAGELLGELLGDDPALGPLKQLLIERTDGNPFFLEESIRDLAETGALVGARGSYRLARALPTVHVPATVQVVLAARIDRLSPEDKRLLQAAAVIGKTVAVAVLDRIASLSSPSLEASLTRLQIAELLFDTGRFPDAEYAFTHVLTREVAYGSLLREQRRALHARIAEALARPGRGQAAPDTPDAPDTVDQPASIEHHAEHVEQLAHHALHGELWDLALASCRQAGDRAAARSAYRDAVTWYERALEALAHLPESRSTLEQAIDVRLSLRGSLFLMGQLAQVVDRLREAESLAERLNDDRRLGWVASYLCSSLWLLREYRRAEQAGQRALTTALRLGDLALEVDARSRLSHVYFELGELGQSAALCREVIQALEGDLLTERFGQSVPISIQARQYLGYNLSELGGWTEGFARGEEAIRLAETLGNPFGLTLAWTAVGLLHLKKGELDSALVVLRRAYEVCRSADLVQWFDTTATYLGLACVRDGRVSEGRPLLQAAWEARIGQPWSIRSLHATWLGEAHVLEGRLDEAAEWAARALDLAQSAGERGHAAWALRLQGEIAARRDPPADGVAEAAFGQAIAIAAELGMRPLLAHVHLALGALYRQVGRSGPAQTEMSAAVELLRALDMTRWLPDAEAGLAQASASSA